MSKAAEGAAASFSPEPRAVYTHQLEASATEASRFSKQERLISHLRLAVFVLGVAIGWLAFGSHVIDPLWFAPPVVVFLALLIVHDRVIRLRRKADRTVDFFAKGLARMDDRWAGTGNTGEIYRDEAHPYADDLDIFGEASLFELLCTARTAAGAAQLGLWLTRPGEPTTVRARQEAVAELTPRVELRRDLSLLGEEVGGQLSPGALERWGVADSILPRPGLRFVAALASTLTTAGLLAWIFTDIGGFPFLFFLFTQSTFALALRARVRPVLAGVEAPSHDLVVLSGLLARLEREPVEASRLVELRRDLETNGVAPSHRISELRRLVDLLDARRNQFFAPIGALLLWSTQLAIALERWRAVCGPSLGPWISAASEIEAMCSLAGYAFEHPNDIFPEILDEGPLFEGEGLGHPLIPDVDSVRNQVSLGGDLRALMMSGSNMSGKSTLLRTVGCNTVLALAGAPVRATRLKLSPLQIGASIRISDSLQAGASHFFAEITRLRCVVDLTDESLPVLFLLDEVLHGTNSHDRRIGANAVLRGLIARGAIGIVTTHDLALAEIAEELAPRVVNVHFQDHIEDGQMCFDYKLRPGVVTRSNAIELMRSVGLDV